MKQEDGGEVARYETVGGEGKGRGGKRNLKGGRGLGLKH